MCDPPGPWFDRDAQRLAREMVEYQLRGRGIRDPAVLAAMAQVPRHWFVPEAPLAEAYADHPLPTAEGQTISQPYMVAVMTERLGVRPGHRVLEVGTGSGYQAAVLAQMGARVVTVERSAGLSARARAALERLGMLDRVQLVVGDGTLGYEPAAPYDGILVTAGAPRLPEACRRQIADGGRIVIPLGDPHEQQLLVYERRGPDWHITRDTGCRFVPLVGRDGWPG